MLEECGRGLPGTLDVAVRLAFIDLVVGKADNLTKVPCVQIDLILTLDAIIDYLDSPPIVLKPSIGA